MRKMNVHKLINTLLEVKEKAYLAYLIESKVSCKAEIKELLGGFIISREKRCPHAAKIWEKDLEYVNEYNYNNKKIKQKGKLIRISK